MLVTLDFLNVHILITNLSNHNLITCLGLALKSFADLKLVNSLFMSLFYIYLKNIIFKVSIGNKILIYLKLFIW